MLKLVGAALLMGGGLYIGMAAARDLRRRGEDLACWQAALGLLAGELTFRLPALPDLLSELSHRTAQPAAGTFAAAEKGMARLGEQSLEEIWTNAVRKSPGALAEEDVVVLVRLGSVLGRCGAEDQKLAVESVRDTLADHAAQVREDLRSKGRAYVTLGASAGAMLTILLL